MSLNLPFEDALEDLRITGCVLLHETYEPPWAIEIPGQAELQAAMKVGGNIRVVPFHLVRRGGFQMVTGGTERLDVACRDVAICPGGAQHRMQQGAAVEAMPLARILAGERQPLADDGSAEVTELICGVFLLRAAPLNPLLAALPPVLKVATGEANAMLAHVAEMLALEIQRRNARFGGFTATRLLDVFCAEILRAYQGQMDAPEAGWFRGLADAKIAKALALIHGEPAAWSVEKLADAVALSPSRFAARFRDLTGETVMAYVTRWRMVRACRLLENPDETVESVANKVGYSAASSFSRAFKSCLGVNPAQWRQAA